VNVLFSDRGWEDYLHWQQFNLKILKKVNQLIQDISRDDPYEGIGKPEPLKHAFSGYWSRRITDEHRLVYRISNDRLEIAQARYHYKE
jgi:toxin YoeB